MKVQAMIPQEVYDQLTEEQKQTWRRGTVVEMLVKVGIPIINLKTIPHILWRINMDVMARQMQKLMNGMPHQELLETPIMEPALLKPYCGAAVAGPDFKPLTAAQFCMTKLGIHTVDLGHIPLGTLVDLAKKQVKNHLKNFDDQQNGAGPN